MAEFVMKDLVRRSGLEGEYEIASAATSREEIGNPVYPPARKKLAEHGIGTPENELGVAEKRARQMTFADYEYYDQIICMDRLTLNRAVGIAKGDPANKISMLLDHTQRCGEEVADPWYTGNFDATWTDVLEGCTALLQQPPQFVV